MVYDKHDGKDPLKIASICSSLRRASLYKILGQYLGVKDRRSGTLEWVSEPSAHVFICTLTCREIATGRIGRTAVDSDARHAHFR